MQTVNIEPFQVIGISVRTINGHGQAAQDIGGLWQKFLGEGIMDKIPNKISPEILSIYTNYEGDHTQAYDTILCCKVSSLDEVPEGMVAQAFEGGTYQPYQAKGNLTEGAVYQAWHSIWNADLDRTYTADFEVYGDKAQDPSNAEVDIFVAIN